MSSMISHKKHKLNTSSYVLYDLYNSRVLDLPESSEYQFKTKHNNLVQSVIENEAYCFDVEKFSEKLVDATTQEAIQLLRDSQTEFAVRNITCPIIDSILTQVVEPTHPNDAFPYNTPEEVSTKVDIPPYTWSKTSDFNINQGQEEIEKYVETWKRSSDWMFCVEFSGFESEECSNVFVYEVEWCKPTWSYPIPQATASVYFALDVFKAVDIAHDRSIDVSYIFECSSLIHKPGRIDFQEQWLQYIIDEKLKLFKKMTFSVSNFI